MTEVQGDVKQTNKQMTEVQGDVKQTNKQLTEVQGDVKQTNKQMTEVQGDVKQTNKQLNGIYGCLKQIAKYILPKNLQIIEQKIIQVQQEQCDQRINLLDSYIDLYADQYSYLDGQFNLINQLNQSKNLAFEIAKQFIEDQNQKVLLINGDIGTGKTLFSYYLTSHLLLIKNIDSILPIYIYLPELSNQNQLFDSSNKQYFETLYKELNISDIEQYLYNSKNYILILDGFSETQCIDQWKSMKNQLYNKVIVTCRSQYSNQYITAFCDNQHKLCMMDILPFDEEQISKYLKLNTKDLNSQQHNIMNNAVKDIYSLVKTPLILSQFVKSIPKLVQQNHSIYSKQQTSQINKLTILEQIIFQWFNREAFKLETYGEWYDNNIKNEFESFLCTFALDLYNNKNIITYNINLNLDSFQYLSVQYNVQNTDNNKLIMSKRCTPINLKDDCYSFIGKEIRDYFIYLGLIKNLLKQHNLYNKEKQVLFELQNVEYQKVQFNFDNFTFNQILIQDQDVLNYFVAKCLLDTNFEFMINEIVKQSKQTNNLNVASANSMTIISMIGKVFIQQDFSKIKIPRANITNGLFFNCNFNEADLEGCNLQYSHISNCTFDNANMKDVAFGQSTDNIEKCVLNGQVQKSLLFKQTIYIPLLGSDYNQFDVEKKVQEFIHDSNKNVLLITGNAFCGKTTFCQHLTKLLLDQKQYYNSSIMPLYVNLQNLNNFDQILQQIIEYNQNDISVDDLKFYMYSKKPFLLILDAYDEICHQNSLQSIYNNVLLRQNCKIIFTCRTCYILNQPEYEQLFYMDMNSLSKIQIASINDCQIKKYVKQFCQINKKCSDTQYYLEFIQNSLCQQVNNPFILYIICNYILYNQNINQIHTNNIQTINSILSTWFNKEANKQSISNSEIDLKVQQYNYFAQTVALVLYSFNISSFQYNFTYSSEQKNIKQIQNMQADKKADKYTKDLQKINTTSIYFSNNQIDNLFKTSKFQSCKGTFDNNLELAQYLSACPLNIQDNTYSFLHEEFYKYFITQALVFELNQTVQLENFNEANQKIEILDPDFQFNRKLITDQIIICNISNICSKDKLFKCKLLNLIYKSKTDKNINIASANAMTILNQINTIFINDDFRNIQVQGANMSRCQLYNCNLEGANLEGCNLQYAYLQKCNLRNTNLQNIDFGQKPDLIEHKNQVISISSNNKYIYSASFDNTVKHWLLSTGKCINTVKILHKGINTFAFSFDGSQFCTGSVDGTVKLWETKSSKCNITFNDYILVKIHDQQIKQMEVNRMSRITVITLSKNNKFICTGAEDGTINIWEILDKHNLKHIYCIQGYYTNDESKLTNKNAQKYTQNTNGHKQRITSLCFSSNNKYICSGSQDQSIKLWSLDSHTDGGYMWTFEQHQDQVSSLCFSQKDKYIISGSWDKTIKLWDIALKKCILTLNGHVDTITSICISDDGQYIYSGSNDNSIKVWKLEIYNNDDNSCVSGKCINTLIGHTNIVQSLNLNNDNLISGSKDKSIKFWKINPIIQNNENHMNNINHMIFSNDGNYLCSSSIDGVIKVWETQTGNNILSINAHSCTITAICFSFNGKYICSGCEDGYVKVWNVETAQCVQTLLHLNSVNAVSFSQDNEYVCSGSIQTIYLQLVTGGQKETFITQNNINQLFFNQEDNSIYVLVQIGNKQSLLIIDKQSKQYKQHKLFNTLIDHIYLLFDNNKICYTSSKDKLYISEDKIDVKCLISNDDILTVGSSDKKNVYVTYKNGNIQVFSNEGKCLHQFQTFISSINSIYYSHLKKYIASCEFNVVYLLNENQKIIWKTNNNMLDLRKCQISKTQNISEQNRKLIQQRNE
ncbi:Pentapeptide_repeats-containing protein [Hexamita inflata]|uniref:Pentapeptide_repeats-containing protein n=1 Tax=Hexamita inflata TaxID=28002 RepID=A0ABP1GFW1_9EUKA